MGLIGPQPETEDFYDRWTELFLRGFGPVFQAGTIKTGHPPREDPERSIAALAERAGVVDGDRILDAGCGVGGPAAIMARKFPTLRVDGVTKSVLQARIGRERLAEAGLSDRVAIHVADYQRLPFPEGTFDLVLFFESTGYATDLDETYLETARVLKPGGRLYVKDVFCRSVDLNDGETAQIQAFDRLWGCVRTKTREESVASMVAAGLEVGRARVLDDIGTALLAGSMFQLQSTGELVPTELGKVFAKRALDAPIEFGEIAATKPGG